jgi:hypothetical protein
MYFVSNKHSPAGITYFFIIDVILIKRNGTWIHCLIDIRIRFTDNSYLQLRRKANEEKWYHETWGCITDWELTWLYNEKASYVYLSKVNRDKDIFWGSSCFNISSYTCKQAVTNFIVAALVEITFGASQSQLLINPASRHHATDPSREEEIKFHAFLSS